MPTNIWLDSRRIHNFQTDSDDEFDAAISPKSLALANVKLDIESLECFNALQNQLHSNSEQLKSLEVEWRRVQRETPDTALVWNSKFIPRIDELRKSDLQIRQKQQELHQQFLREQEQIDNRIEEISRNEHKELTKMLDKIKVIRLNLTDGQELLETRRVRPTKTYSSLLMRVEAIYLGFNVGL